MRKHNGKQLYGIQKILTTLKMDMQKELRKLSIKKKYGWIVLADFTTTIEFRIPRTFYPW